VREARELMRLQLAQVTVGADGAALVVGWSAAPGRLKDTRLLAVRPDPHAEVTRRLHRLGCKLPADQLEVDLHRSGPVIATVTHRGRPVARLVR